MPLIYLFVSLSTYFVGLNPTSWSCWVKGPRHLKCKYMSPNCAIGNLYPSTYSTANIVWEGFFTPMSALVHVHLISHYQSNQQMFAFPWFLVRLNIFLYHWPFIFLLLWIACSEGLLNFYYYISLPDHRDHLLLFTFSTVFLPRALGNVRVAVGKLS